MKYMQKGFPTKNNLNSTKNKLTYFRTKKNRRFMNCMQTGVHTKNNMNIVKDM